MPNKILSLTAFAVTWLALTAGSEGADIIVRRSVKGKASGDVTDITKTEVTLKVRTPRDETVKIPANDIVEIEWTGEKDLRLARSAENGGRLDDALKGYTTALESNKGNAKIVADVEYFIGRATAKAALSDPTKLDDAIKKLEAFKSGNSDSYHYYNAMNYLGQLYVAKKEYIKAAAAFDTLQKAPWKDYQMAARNASGRALIQEAKLTEAGAAFDAVIAMKADNPLEESERQAALLGKSSILIAEKKHDEALKLLTDVIQQSSPEDRPVQAEAFLRQGICLQQLGKDRESVLAFLHVDVLFAGEKTAHAEALFHLSRQWAKVGQADRATEARDRLEADYPKSEWVRQLKAPAAEG